MADRVFAYMYVLERLSLEKSFFRDWASAHLSPEVNLLAAVDKPISARIAIRTDQRPGTW